MTGLEIGTEDYDTFTGLVFDILGRIPSDGKQLIELELPTMKIAVTEVVGHQIEKATVTLKKIEQVSEES